MKAAVLRKLKSPLVIEDIPIPEYGPKDVLLKVKQCGICVTDIHIANGSRPVSYTHLRAHETYITISYSVFCL